MQKKTYVPSRCPSCDYWTLHEVVIVAKGANLICSYCNESILLSETEKKVKSFVSNMKKVFPFMIAMEPALQTLNKPGDHVSVSRRGSKKK